MATTGMNIGPTPEVVDLAAGVDWSVQNVSDDHSAVLRFSIQPTGTTPAANTFGAVKWLDAVQISRKSTEAFWMYCQGADACDIVYERAQ